jgi:tetratricopeptide (TPR) repeat protein
MHLRPRPLPEDLDLARELIKNGELLYRVTGFDHPLLHRHLGLAYNLLNQHEAAIPHLEKAVQYVDDPEGVVVVRALVESLVKTGQTDRAVRLLETPVRNPELREACQHLLADLKAGRL